MSHYTSGVFKILEDTDTEKEYLRVNCKKMLFASPFLEVDYSVSCTYQEGEKVYGYGLATIYKRNTIGRANQWDFGSNRPRQIWIDELWSNKNVGKQIMQILENKLLQKGQDLEKRNIYIMALSSASGFYQSLGYEEIVMEETDEDEDSPYIFVECNDPKCWMAKGMIEKLQGEELSELKIGEWYFGDALGRMRVDLLQKIFIFPIPSYKYLESLRDKSFEGVKISASSLQEVKISASCDEFETLLKKYLSGNDFSKKSFCPLEKYFSIDPDLAREMINNYYLN